MMGSIYERDAYLRGEEKGKTEGLREGEARGLRAGETKGLNKGVQILKQTLLELGKTPEEIEVIVQAKYGTEFGGMIQEAETYGR